MWSLCNSGEPGRQDLFLRNFLVNSGPEGPGAILRTGAGESRCPAAPGRSGAPGRVHVPVVEPGLAAVGGEGLFPAGRVGGDAGPPVPGEYRNVVVGVLAEELADFSLESSGNRRE